MRAIRLWAAALAMAMPAAAAEPRILVFGKVEAGQYVHEAIPTGARALMAMGPKEGFIADTTTDAEAFTAANLARYKAVVFNNTGGEVLDPSQRTAFQGFLRGGGGYAGIHSACGTEYGWPWYGEMIGGGRFLKHPPIQKAAVRVEDGKHASTSMLPVRWERTDEWHDYQANPRGKCTILLTLDEASYQGGAMGADHPIAWCRQFEGGRAWFTGLGHTLASYSEPLFLAHLAGGIKYAIGEAATVALSAPRAGRADEGQAPRFEIAAGRAVWIGAGETGIRDALGVLRAAP